MTALIALRDRALIFYLLGTAARISEALQVQRTSFEQAMVPTIASTAIGGAIKSPS